MKLYLNRTSPYARLALATALEAGLSPRLEWLEPWDDPPALLALNPLAKIPALVTDGGTALVESGCICDYFVERKASLRPRGEEALRRLGLGRAVMDCAFGAVIQRRFNGGRDTGLSSRWLAALPRAAAVLEAMAREPQPDLGDIAVAVAFDYIDFRLPELTWRKTSPALARTVDVMRSRVSMSSTAPPPISGAAS